MPNSQESSIRRMQEFYTKINGVMEDPVLRGYAEMHGYDQKKLQSMQEEWERVMELVNQFSREHKEQLDATDELHDRLEELQNRYKRHLEFSRIRFKRAPEVLDKLGALGERKRTQAGIMDQIRDFYDTALHHPKAHQGFEDINICEPELQEGADEIRSLFDLKQHQEKEMGESQQARVERDKGMDALDEEVSEMTGYVAIEAKYNGEEQRLEQLGILVRSD